MPAQEYPVGTFPPTEAKTDPAIKKMDLADLSELVKWPSKMEEFAQEHPTPEPPPEVPEPTEPPPVEPPEPEPDKEPVPAAEPEKTAEPTQEDIDKEILRTTLEAIEAQNKKLEAKIVGREAGERGYINQLKERIRKLEAGESAEPSYREPVAETEAPPPIDGIRKWAVQKASQEAVQGFLETHPDSKDLEAETLKYLTDSGFNAQQIIQLDDPIAASRETTRLLEEAYWHVKEVRTRSRISELQTKKADQVRGLDEAKRRAAPSASGAPPAPPPQQKALKDLSLSELEAKMRALSGR